MMDFYSSDILSAPSAGLNTTCASSSPSAIQPSLVDYHHPSQTFSSTQSPPQPGSNLVIPNVFQSQHFSNSSPRTDPCLRSGAVGFVPANEVVSCPEPGTYQAQPLPPIERPADLSQHSPPAVTDSLPLHQLQFQLDGLNSNPVTSDPIACQHPHPHPHPLNLSLNDDDLSNSILNSCSSQANLLGLGGYVDCSDLSNLHFQSTVDQAFIGFDPSFGIQETHSDPDLDDDRSNSSLVGLPQLAQQGQLQLQTHHQPCWQGFSSPSSGLDDDHQHPLSPAEPMRAPSPHLSHQSNLYYTPPQLYRYTEPSAVAAGLEMSHSPAMIRTGSTASDFSTGSSATSAGVNPIHVNPLSQPVTPQDDLFGPLSDPFQQSWWGSQPENPSVDSFVTSVRASMGLMTQNGPDDDAGARVGMVFGQPGAVGTSSPCQTSSLQSESPYNLPHPTMPPQSPLAPLSSGHHSPSKPRRTAHRSTLSALHRSASSKISSRTFLIEPDYSRLPTKRSRGRRPPISPDLGLPIPDGHLSIGLQAVPGGQAFDPNLNPNAETVKYCELTKTGKPKKIFICQVKGCGKCFKRSEHLKRHVRSIHTNDKPYNCPWMACNKSFSRHDNLNQHLRVHRVEEGGQVLNGLHIGSDGVLRSDVDESPVDPIMRGLRNVEVVDRYLMEE